MSAHASSPACDRAREWASRDLDADLSPFELVLLDAHLAGCATCRAFAADAVAFTRALREAELDRVRVLVPQHRRPVRARSAQLAAAAALVVSAAGLGGVLGTLSGGGVGGGAPTAFRPAPAAPTSDPLLRDLRLATLLHAADGGATIGERKPPLPVTL